MKREASDFAGDGAGSAARANVWTVPWSTVMQLETKYLRLCTAVTLGSRFGDWRTGFCSIRLATDTRQSTLSPKCLGESTSRFSEYETRQGHQQAGSADRRPDQKALRPVGHGDVIRP